MLVNQNAQTDLSSKTYLRRRLIPCGHKEGYAT